MTKRYLIPLLASLIAASCPAAAQSPRWSWARRDGNVTYNINPDYARQVVAATGSRVLWGTVQNQRMIYTTMLGDYKIQELDTAGTPTATTTITGKLSLLQAAADAAGNWYLLGSYYDSLRVGSGPDITRAPNGLAPEYVLLRLHAGTLAQDWLTTVGGDSYCTTQGFSLEGNAIRLSIDSADASAIVTYDLATGRRATQLRQRTRTCVSGVVGDASGGTYVLGHCAVGGSVDFNGTPTPIPATLAYPWYLVRYDAAGAYSWHYFFNDVTCVNRALTANQGNGVFLSGDLFDSMSIGPYAFPQRSTSNYMTASIDSTGHVNWAGDRVVAGPAPETTQTGGSQRRTMLNDNYIMFAEARGSITWDTGSVRTNMPSLNAVVVGHLQSGRPVWTKPLSADFSNAQQIATDGSALYVTGVASDLSRISFDSLRVSTSAVPGKYVPYLAKLDTRQPALDVRDNSTVAHGLYAFPNPATTSLSIYSTDGGAGRIVDALGRRVWNGALTADKATIVDVSGWPRGMYLLQEQGPNDRKVLKLIIR